MLIKPAQHIMVGSTISQYQVLEKLGEGGMGIVYKARDTKLNRFVAVKVLPPDLVADPGRRSRFTQEAKAASALNHPNIITIHDIVSHQAGECIVMELVDGSPLSQLIAEKELQLGEILKIAAQVADAIAAAHAAGIIHRDLKPSNIMVTESGLVKVLDFGLAKLAGRARAVDAATLTMLRTDSGMVVGTPGYMSPEQIRGQELDRRSDIFNFGLVLYEMLSGTKAFQGDTSADVMSAILKETPPDLTESAPAAVRQIVAVCLEKNPVNRFESARDIGHALRALTAGTSLTGAMPKLEAEEGKRLWKRTLPFALAATFIAAIAFAVLYFLGPPEMIDLSTYKYSPFATDPEPEMKAVWSPDGQSIAYLKRIAKTNQLFVRSLSSPVPTHLTRVPPGRNEFSVLGRPFWSPQGDKIFFITDSGICSVGVAGGDPQLVISDAHTRAAAISPDGKTLALSRLAEGIDKKMRTSLWISSPPGAVPRRYEPAPFEFLGSGGPQYLCFSPDGSKIVVSVPQVFIWLLDWPDGPKAKQRRLFPKEVISLPPSIDWLPDSRHLAMAISGGLWLRDTKTDRLECLTSSAAGDQIDLSVSPNGQRIVFTLDSSDYDIVEIPFDGSGARPYLSTSRNESSPSLSLAGDRLAYITDQSGSQEIWLKSVSGDWRRPIVTKSNFPDDSSLRFDDVHLSPDGTRIAFSARAHEAHKIWISSTAGGKPMLAVPGNQERGWESAPSWSPDGAFLAFLAYTDHTEIAVARVGSQEQPTFHKPSDSEPDTPPVWSLDGSSIAYGSGEKLILISPEGRLIRELACPVKAYLQYFVMVWSQDSSTIYVASSQSETAELYAVDVKTGKARKIADLGEDLELRVAINYCLTATLTADGKSLLTSARINRSDLWILEGFPQPGQRRKP